MKSWRKIFEFKKIPALALAFGTAGFSFALPFIFAGFLYFIGQILGSTNEALGNFLAYLFTGFTVAIMCFYICKAHPGSSWYTPIVCNLVTILIGLLHYFGGNPEITLPFAIGWLLSISASIWGMNRGRGNISRPKIH